MKRERDLVNRIELASELEAKVQMLNILVRQASAELEEITSELNKLTNKKRIECLRPRIFRAMETHGAVSLGFLNNRMRTANRQELSVELARMERDGVIESYLVVPPRGPISTRYSLTSKP